MSAALVLAEAGQTVDLFERSRALGGRAGSLLNRRAGTAMDRGQHVLLGCCTNLLDFYRRIGGLDRINFLDSLPFIGRDGRVTVMSESFLPEPLHLLPSLLRSPHLSRRDKLRTPKLLKAALRCPDADVACAQWLIRMGQSKEAITGFWEPVLAGALNEGLDRASAGYAAKVIREALVVNRAGFRMGVADVPLSELHGTMARNALERRGVRVHLGQTVRQLTVIGSRVDRADTTDGEPVGATHFVVAVNPQTAPILPDANSAEPRFVYAPGVNLYFWFEDDVGVPPAFCLPGRRFQWGFNRTAIATLPENARSAVVMVASAARDLVSWREKDVLSLGIEELRSAFPRLSFVPLACSTVLKIRSATFSPVPGCDGNRPGQRTAISNLHLAGDWTNTGWPSTMEGAVRSGYLCARDVLAAEGIESRLPIADLPRRGLFRWFGRPSL